MKVHLMGIGGAGVSALARVFLARGGEVSGCDLRESDTTAELEDAGVRVFIGHDPEHVLFQDLLVYSGAIKSSPEVAAARAMGVKVLSRAEMLAELINEFDHPDHFKDVDEVQDLFARFAAALPADGIALLCADDERALSLETPARRITYGFSEGADYRCGEGRPFPLHHAGQELGTVNLRQPGRHNVQNATAAAAMAMELGVSFAEVAGALERFPGARRRLEFLGVFQGAPVYDDYAHHPTKVRATLQAARELRHRRLIVVFQPHRYSRLAALLRDFSRAFTGADRVLVLDVYSAGEENPTGIQARDLADVVPNGIYVGSFERAREALEGLVGRDDILLLMGAGDIRKLGDELAQRV